MGGLGIGIWRKNVNFMNSIKWLYKGPKNTMTGHSKTVQCKEEIDWRQVNFGLHLRRWRYWGTKKNDLILGYTSFYPWMTLWWLYWGVTGSNCLGVGNYMWYKNINTGMAWVVLKVVSCTVRAAQWMCCCNYGLGWF